MNEVIASVIMLASVTMADGTEIAAVGEFYPSVAACRSHGMEIAREIRDTFTAREQDRIRDFEFVCESTDSQEVKKILEEVEHD